MERVSEAFEIWMRSNGKIIMDVVQATGLGYSTVKRAFEGKKVHTRTLTTIASLMSVTVEELVSPTSVAELPKSRTVVPVSKDVMSYVSKRERTSSKYSIQLVKDEIVKFLGSSGFSVSELSELCGVSVSTVYKIISCTGNVSSSIAKKLASGMDVSLDLFVSSSKEDFSTFVRKNKRDGEIIERAIKIDESYKTFIVRIDLQVLKKMVGDRKRVKVVIE